MKPEPITLDLAQESDTDRILQINQQEYGPGDILATRADYAWRHEQNPAGRALVPVIRDNSGGVIGFIWVLPVRLRHRGREYVAAAATNLVIEPAYRKTIHYARLMRHFQQVFQQHNIPLHFSFVSEQTYRRVQRQTPPLAGTIPLLAKLLDGDGWAQDYFSRAWQRLAWRWAGPLLSAFFVGQRPGAASPEIRVEPAEHFDDGFDAFWLQLQDKYPLMGVRDRAFLAWRFARVSGRDYRIWVAKSPVQMLGYAVLRCSTIRKVKVGLILDLLVSEDDSGQKAGALLLAGAEAYFRSQGMAWAAALMPAFAGESGLLRQAGYRALPPSLSPRQFRFTFSTHQGRGNAFASLSVQDSFITFADHESF
jgi:GNAT superfamily N-acetyltransferase